MIPISISFKLQLEDLAGTPVKLISCSFTSGIRRFALWRHDVFYAGNTYYGNTPISVLDPVMHDQATPMTAQVIRFEVQNDPSLLQAIAQEARRRLCDGYLVMLDDAGAVIEDEAIHIWQKTMSTGNITSDGETYFAEIQLDEVFWEYRNRAIKTYSDADQRQYRDGTDQCFKQMGGTFTLNATYTQKSGLSSMK
jgi:hypothetical protein